MPIVHDSYNDKALALHEALDVRLPAGALPDDLYVVLGGDGFMLKTVRQHQRPGVTFLGVNCGRLGFLLNDSSDDVGELVGWLRGPLDVLDIPRIGLTGVAVDGRELSALALNDIYLERMTGQSAHLRLSIDGHCVVEEMVSDGLICCTALGSTAYNFSTGASVCHPTLPVLGVTPICVHTPALRSMYVPLSARVTVEVVAHNRRPVRAVADGVDFDDVLKVEIFDARAPVRLAFFPHHDFTRTLVRKLIA